MLQTQYDIFRSTIWLFSLNLSWYVKQQTTGLEENNIHAYTHILPTHIRSTNSFPSLIPLIDGDEIIMGFIEQVRVTMTRLGRSSIIFIIILSSICFTKGKILCRILWIP